MDRRDLLAGERGPALGREAAEAWRVALVFPNTYHVGMSSLGFQIVHQVLLSTPGVGVGRFFIDTMAGGSIEAGAPLRGTYPPDDATRAEYEAWKKKQR